MEKVIPIRAHALCSPSSADRWYYCTGSVALEEGEPDTESDAASEGTHAHDLAAQWLITGMAPPVLLPDTEMHAALRLYVEFVHKRRDMHKEMGAAVETLIEQKLPLEDVTGERNATGTADTVLIARYADHAELEVIDLKYGRGVEVSDDTLQLPIYGLGALAKYSLMDDFTLIHTTVAQPRMRSEFNTTTYEIAQLNEIGAKVFTRAQEALGILIDGVATATGHLTVTEKGCRFCKAQYKCPAKGKQIHDTVYGELQAIEDPEIMAIAEDNFTGPPADFAKLLPLFMMRVPEIEAWCKYVRAKVEQLLLAGQPVEGFKLVQGRMGARQWISSDSVLPVLKYGQVPRELAMTPPELRSPADLEKKLKTTYPTVWESIQEFIVQAPGKPSVAPESDKRPAFAGPVFDGESYSGEDLV